MKFGIQKLKNLDLTTAAGWDGLAAAETALTAAIKSGNFGTFNTAYLTRPGEYDQRGSTSVAQDGFGTLEFDGLEVAAYLVTEISNIGETVTDSSGKEVTLSKKSTPFIVTVPTAKPGDTGGWNYDVFVYPKNSVSDITKSVSDPIASIPDAAMGTSTTPAYGVGTAPGGAIIPWDITVTIPDIAQGVDFEQFLLTDTLDSRLTPIDNNGNIIYDVTFRGKDAGTEVKTSRQTTGASLTGSQLSINLLVNFGKWNSDTGKFDSSIDANKNTNLLLEQDTYQGGTVKVRIYTRATALTGKGSSENAGIINNSASLTTQTYDKSVGESADRVTITSTLVTSFWGGLTITKTDDATSVNKLAGAEFQIYVVTSSAAKAGDSCTTSSGVGTSPISVANSSTFTTGNDGTVSIPGLYVANSDINGGSSLSTKLYCLIETKAPTGYQKAGTGTVVTVKVGAATASTVTVTNTKTTITLPVTGAQGRVIMTVLGASIVALAVGSALYMKSKKKRRG